MALKYKVGDKVRIKSLDWYNENKTLHGDIWFDNAVFVGGQSLYCGCELTIRLVRDDNYYVIENDYYWTDEMIEGLVEEETKSEPKFKIGDKVTNGQDKLTISQIHSDKYIVVDNLGECGTLYFNAQNGWKLMEKENKKEDIAWMYDGKLVVERFNDGVIKQPKYNKLSINTEFCDDKIELVISPDFELKQEDDKWFAVKKKKEYPKTYEECREILKEQADVTYGYKKGVLHSFQKLLVCRDAYWKIAGEEMGLGKPWEPTKDKMVYSIYRHSNEIETDIFSGESVTFEFPTPKMRDAFKENFDPDIEFCKELL